MIKVLFVSSEASPFFKTGGLGDVAFSLPKALRNIGIDIRVVIPKYYNIEEKFIKKMKLINTFEVLINSEKEYCNIKYIEYDKVPYYLLENENYFERDTVYGYDDDGDRFAFFSKAVLEYIKHIDFKPDIIHCNDWHTGMISPLLKTYYKDDELYSKIKTIFTIHNLRYQGIFTPEILNSPLNMGMEFFHPEALEFYGGVSFIKGGINYSDIITTVSETYAKEILTPEYGEGLDGLLRKVNNRIHGIKNGIDIKLYNPRTDNYIFNKFSVYSIKNKVKNKLRLQEYLGIDKGKDIPLIGMVTRLTKMKGIDLVVQAIEELMSMNVQMVILGKGDSYYEEALKDYVKKFPDKMSVNISFDDSLARRIYAGSDMFLMPSMFEPCGLSQMIALRYGSIPIARNTGGLRDTLVSYDKDTEKGDGFIFSEYSVNHMMDAIKRALEIYQNKKTWNKIITNAMKADNSWDDSSKKYKQLYETLIS